VPTPSQDKLAITALRDKLALDSEHSLTAEELEQIGRFASGLVQINGLIIPKLGQKLLELAGHPAAVEPQPRSGPDFDTDADFLGFQISRTSTLPDLIDLAYQLRSQYSTDSGDPQELKRIKLISDAKTNLSDAEVKFILRIGQSISAAHVDYMQQLGKKTYGRCGCMRSCRPRNEEASRRH